MLTRREFIKCLFFCGVGTIAPLGRIKHKPFIFCAADIDPADAIFHSAEKIDWQNFYLSEVPNIFDICCKAFEIKQTVYFSDELPIQSSWNSIDPDEPQSPRMFVGVGNLEAYPFSTLIAVILHELGHIFCYRSKIYEQIVSNSVKRQRELLADVMAGSAFAKIEGFSVSTRERVRGQCSDIELPWEQEYSVTPAKQSHPKNPPSKATLNARKLLSSRASAAHFLVLRSDGTIEFLQNYSMIGETPEEDPDGTRCVTAHNRPVDFVAMVAAVSSWRTFGDLPEAEESHGTPSERYQSFAFGYHTYLSGHQNLEKCLNLGLAHLGINF